MTTLSIWKFDTPDAAEQALRTLERLQLQRLVVVDDASVVAWPADRRRPRTYQADGGTGSAALSGAFWGLLFGTVFLLPLAGTAIGAATGAAFGLSRVGLADEFLGQVRDRIVPGTSALFLLTHDAVVDRIADAFAGTHADLLVTNLGHDEEAALRRAFGAHVDEPAPLA
jgi:uncharacterized membrane protein